MSAKLSVFCDREKLLTLRGNNNWVRKEVADKADGLGLPVSESVLYKAESGRRVSIDTAEALAQIYGVTYDEVVLPEYRREEAYFRKAGTPANQLEEFVWDRLYQFGGGYVSAIRLFGSATQFVTRERLHVAYTPEEFKISPDLAPGMKEWISAKRREAKKAGRTFFNGPNTCLIKWRDQVRDGAGAAVERTQLELQVGPVGWFDFAWLNERLRGTLTTPQICENYVGLSHIMRNGDVSKSKLANIFDCAVTVITTDGFVGYQVRSDRNASVPNQVTSAVAENINRYLDETTPDGKGLLHPTEYIGDLRKAPGHTYRPSGVPHPFAAASRGIKAELSPSLVAHIRPNAIKLVGLSYGLDSFHPDALFVAAVDRTAEEVLQIWRRDPGKEWREGQLKFTRADFDDRTTQEILADASWVPGGKASFVRVIELVDSVKQEFKTGFSGAFEILASAP